MKVERKQTALFLNHLRTCQIRVWETSGVLYITATLKGSSVDEMSKRRMLFVLCVEQPVTTWLLVNLFQACLLGMGPQCLL